jgi:Cu/Ag efflux protein CusF
MKIRMKPLAMLLAGGLAAWLAGPAMAQSTVGEVRKVDKAQGKITLQHGPIDSLKMPPMTMAYRVQNPAWLDQVKEGDKVRFDAEKVNGQFTITALKPGA